MKKAVILAICLFSVNAFAGGDRHDKMLERMTHKLDLSPAQVEQANAIMTAQKPEIEALRQQMKVLRASSKQQFSAILTVEQLEKFNALDEKRKHKKKKHMKGREA